MTTNNNDDDIFIILTPELLDVVSLHLSHLLVFELLEVYIQMKEVFPVNK